MAYIEVEKGNGRKRGIFSEVRSILSFFCFGFEPYPRTNELVKKFLNKKINRSTLY